MEVLQEDRRMERISTERMIAWSMRRVNRISSSILGSCRTSTRVHQLQISQKSSQRLRSGNKRRRWSPFGQCTIHGSRSIKTTTSSGCRIVPTIIGAPGGISGRTIGSHSPGSEIRKLQLSKLSLSWCWRAWLTNLQLKPDLTYGILKLHCYRLTLWLILFCFSWAPTYTNLHSGLSVSPHIHYRTQISWNVISSAE